MRWGHFVIREMGLANVYLYTKFEISSYPFQMYSIVSLNGWVRDGVCPNSRVDLRRFFIHPQQIWRQYSRMANV